MGDGNFFCCFNKLYGWNSLSILKLCHVIDEVNVFYLELNISPHRRAYPLLSALNWCAREIGDFTLLQPRPVPHNHRTMFTTLQYITHFIIQCSRATLIMLFKTDLLVRSSQKVLSIAQFTPNAKMENTYFEECT
jgi:hypothetical protein